VSFIRCILNRYLDFHHRMSWFPKLLMPFLLAAHCPISVAVSATCFHHLRQLQHIQWMLTAESAATFVHAFVISQIDYCDVVIAGAPKVITNTLQCVECHSPRSDWYHEDRPPLDAGGCMITCIGLTCLSASSIKS